MRRALLVVLLAFGLVPAARAQAPVRSSAVGRWHAMVLRSFPLRLEVVPIGGVQAGGGGGVTTGGTNVFTGSNTFTDSLFFIVDDGDPTKKVQFQLASLTTGNTGLLTLSGTAAATMLTNTGGFTSTAGQLLINGSWNINSTGDLVGWNAAKLGWASAGSVAIGATAETFFVRDGAQGVVQGGVDANGAVVSYTIKGADGITGSNIAGSNLTLASGRGTGNAAAASVHLQVPSMLGTGTTNQVLADRFVACETKTLSNTSATVTNIASVALASNSGGGVRISVSVRCDDGTNFDSDVVTSYVAFVNKATVLTIGTAVTTAAAAANNSGSCTVAPTFTAGTNSVDINVTPVITTIVPTTTTAAVNIENFGVGAVTCK